MNVNIEKISNGFVVTIGSTKTFCDVPEAVCGELAKWALKECERLEKEGNPKKSGLLDTQKYMSQIAQIHQDQQAPWSP